MYSLLVVDDEKVAVRGIVEGINWSSLPFENIFTAMDVEEARQIFQDHSVHVMISDIDMPKENGIHLLEWVNEYSPHTKTIFLTGHADFLYAQQAVQLGSFDYLLKPIDHDELKLRVENALDSVRERDREEEFYRTYEYYYEQWNRQLPLLVERLWQDVLNLRIPAVPSQLDPMFKLYGMGIDTSTPVLPLLISVEEWKKEWSVRDEEIMTYAIKNAAADILLKNGGGHVIQDQNGVVFAMLYDPDTAQVAALPDRCRDYICFCGEYLYAVVSCYVGEPIQTGALRASAGSLSEMERSNVGRTSSVFLLASHKKSRKQLPATPNYQEWTALAEQGKQAELQARIEDLFDKLSVEQVDYTYMAGFYFGLVHNVFQLLQRKMIMPSDIYDEEEWRGGEQAVKSLGAMRSWALRFGGKAAEHLGSHHKEASNTILKVQQFIENNLHLDMNRQMMAEHVYLNPAYLSRLFSKETGRSLTEYMVERRVANACRELERTNVKISDIAVSVGYSNFSYFSNMFKKLTGFTPQEYRKKYQDIT